MFNITSKPSRLARLVFVVSAIVLLACVMPAEAQIGGGTGRGKGKGGRPKRPTPTQPKEADRGDIPGQQMGRIVRFKLAKDTEKDEDLIGTLKIMPLEKGSKSLVLKVRRIDDLTIKVDGHEFEIDECEDVLLKGLHCQAGWDFKDPNAKRKVRQLRTLTFETIEVEGKIVKIEDDVVTIKAVPIKGKQWPDLEALAKGAPQRAGKQKKVRIRKRKLKLRILEDVSKFEDEEKEEVDLDAFEVGKEVTAKVVFSRKTGMMIAMRLPSEGNDVGGGGSRGDGPGRRGGGRPRRPGGG